ncbi:MAG: hypothetical protein ACOCXZ_01815 [Chloroflexota bacterium]
MHHDVNRLVARPGIDTTQFDPENDALRRYATRQRLIHDVFTGACPATPRSQRAACEQRPD